MKIKLHWGVILFALLWTFAAVLPPVREANRTLSEAGRSGSTIGAESSRKTSSDPVAIVWDLSDEMWMHPENQKATLEKWDDLIARYPHQTWIAAARLRRVPAHALELNPKLTPKPVLVQNEWRLRKPLEIAARMEKQEPDNALWPWLQAAFHFALNQRAQGLAAMERLEKTTVLKEYVQSATRARLEWWKKRDNPTWEDRMNLYFQQYYPHLTALRNTVLVAASEASSSRQRGDNVTALRISTALLHTCELWHRDSESFLGQIIAQNLGWSVLETLFDTRLQLDQQTDEGQQRYHDDLRKRWIALCRSQARTDAANKADWLFREDKNARSALFDDYLGSSLYLQNGLKSPWGVLGAFVPYGLFALSLWCFLLGAVWVYGVVSLRRKSQAIVPTRGQIAVCANFGFWSLASACLVAGAYKNGDLLTALTPAYWLRTDNSDSASNVLIFLSALCALACWLLPVFFVGWKRERRFRWVRDEKEARSLGRRLGRARVVAWLLFFVFAAVVASNGRGLWDDTLLQLPVSATIALLSFGMVVTSEIIRFQRSGRGLPRLRVEGEAPPRSTTRAWKLARNGAWLVALVCFYAASLGTSADWPPLLSAVGLPLGVVAVGMALTLNRKVERSDGFTFRLAIRSAGVLSLVWSVAFLLLALGSWPLRAELNRQLDRRLTMKEVDWMEEQVSKNSLTFP